MRNIALTLPAPANRAYLFAAHGTRSREEKPLLDGRMLERVVGATTRRRTRENRRNRLTSSHFIPRTEAAISPAKVMAHWPLWRSGRTRAAMALFIGGGWSDLGCDDCASRFLCWGVHCAGGVRFRDRRWVAPTLRENMLVSLIVRHWPLDGAGGATRERRDGIPTGGSWERVELANIAEITPLPPTARSSRKSRQVLGALAFVARGYGSGRPGACS